MAKVSAELIVATIIIIIAVSLFVIGYMAGNGLIPTLPWPE